MDEGTEADTEEATSSFIDVVNVDSPEKRRVVPENGTRGSVGPLARVSLWTLMLWTLLVCQIVSYQIHCFSLFSF